VAKDAGQSDAHIVQQGYSSGYCSGFTPDSLFILNARKREFKNQMQDKYRISLQFV
jgi:hypothetical protein